jgi:ligand-binding SRPBCC domain-containing protein
VTVYTLHREQRVARPLREVFDFFACAGNLEKLTPPWMHFRILTPQPLAIRQGTDIRYKLRVRWIPITWVSKIEEWNPPYEFTDVQWKGPYRFWHHRHRFSAREGGTSIEDTVRYALPFGLLGRLVHRLQVSRDLARIFDYRAQQVRALFP